ncbi:hypothetical protein JCM10212_006309 [Sporobolomyces blumeae]
MYFPSPLPTTRLSLSTSFVPSGPSPLSRPSTPYRTPGRPSKGKFKDSLGGVQEEEGEEVVAIAKGPDVDDDRVHDDLSGHDDGDRPLRGLWAVLGREEVSIWSTRPKVVLAKLKRTPVSLRTHGSNSLVHFHSRDRIVITTTSGHSLLYSLGPIHQHNKAKNRKANDVYVLPGGEKAKDLWPAGPGEGQDLEGIVIRGEGERSIQVGDGVGCVCVTPSDLLVSVLDPPSLRIIPFPRPSTQLAPSLSSRPSVGRLSRFPSTASLQLGSPGGGGGGSGGASSSKDLASSSTATLAARRGSGWEGLAHGQRGDGESEAVVLDEWEWLVGRDRKDVTISSIVPVPRTATSLDFDLGPSSSHRPSSARAPQHFIVSTSDGRAYYATWGPASTVSSSSASSRPYSHASPPTTPGSQVPTPPIFSSPPSVPTHSTTKPRSNPFSPPPSSATPLSRNPYFNHPPSASHSPYASSSNILFDLDEAREVDPTASTASTWEWRGVCFHPNVPSYATGDGVRGEQEPPRGEGIGGTEWVDLQEKELDKGRGASVVTVNGMMDLVAVGCEDGTVSVYSLSTSIDPNAFSDPDSTSALPSLSYLRPAFSHTHSLLEALTTTSTTLRTSRCTSLAYTSDGLSLAVGWDQGWSVWSCFGRLTSWSTSGVGGSAGDAAGGYGVEGEKGNGFEDHFMSGVRDLFWGSGDLELFVLCPPPVHPKKKPHDEQLFVIPFAKSAVTSAHTPDNTKNGFLQMDDRVLVYRGADQPDMSVINPESDVWQHIKIPATYIAHQHPIRYASISSDARLIAVAGRRGLTHYNALSGRWKLFEREVDEDAIEVKGGMAWWGPVLIVGCLEGGQYQLRLFSRDQPLSLSTSLFTYPLESEPLVLSTFDSSLLVYTADNTFHHFLIRQPKGQGVRLRMCGSIGFEGVVGDPRKVRGVSWLVPKSQQRFGDPADDLNVATIIFLISGRLVLLRPRRAASQEVKYDLQFLSSSIEFFWTHLSGIGTLENSLWGWDGRRIRVWLDALTIEKVRVDRKRDAYESVRESVSVELDFYPLAVLMEKGIVVGVDQEINLRRTLDFALFRIITTTHLFIHHILRFHLSRNQRQEAVLFASHYQHLVYFSHALEILLHGVLEDEADAAASSTPTTLKRLTDGPGGAAREQPNANEGVLPRVVEFLDHFDECLQVVVNCARKTEVARWEFLFDVVGKPRDLFEKCISAGFLKVAASYLLVLHNLEPVEQSSKDTVRLLTTAMEAGEWTLCRELLRFLYSLDRTGSILRAALSESSALPNLFPTSLTPDPRRVVSSPMPSANDSKTTRLSSSTIGPDQSPHAPHSMRAPSMPPARSREEGQPQPGFERLLGRVM